MAAVSVSKPIVARRPGVPVSRCPAREISEFRASDLARTAPDLVLGYAQGHNIRPLLGYSQKNASETGGVLLRRSAMPTGPAVRKSQPPAVLLYPQKVFGSFVECKQCGSGLAYMVFAAPLGYAIRKYIDRGLATVVEYGPQASILYNM